MRERRVNLSHVGKSRIRIRAPVSDWRKKVDPLFVEAALAVKNGILKQRSGDRSAAAEFYAKAEEIRGKFPTRPNGPPTAADLIYSKSPECWPLTANNRARGELEWLHWNRFRTPLWQDAMKAKFDPAASKRITKTIADYDDRRSNPYWIPNFKIDLDHSAVFELGLTLGLEQLTEEELANCFDEVCPCGRRHNPDALRKQRDRLIADLQQAFVWETQIAPTIFRKPVP